MAFFSGGFLYSLAAIKSLEPHEFDSRPFPLGIFGDSYFFHRLQADLVFGLPFPFCQADHDFSNTVSGCLICSRRFARPLRL